MNTDYKSRAAAIRGQLARARQAKDQWRVAELEAELVELTMRPPALWECVHCEFEFDNEVEAERANVVKCPKCGEKDSIRPTLSSKLSHDRRPGKQTKKVPPKPRKPEKVAVRMTGYNVCPCGCGIIPEGGGIFQRGHDGRIAGWIRRLDMGELVKEDVNVAVWRIYRTWIDHGRPGGLDHPKIKMSAIEVIEKMRKKE